MNKTPVKRGELWHLAQEQKPSDVYQHTLEGLSRPAMVVWNESDELGGVVCDVATDQCEIPPESNSFG